MGETHCRGREVVGKVQICVCLSILESQVRCQPSAKQADHTLSAVLTGILSRELSRRSARLACLACLTPCGSQQELPA